MKVLLSALLMLITTSSLAQQQTQAPEVQALQAKLMQELNASLQCTTQAIALQQENTKLKAELDALKKPPEPPKK